MEIFDANWAFRYHGVLPSDLEAGIFGHSLETYAWVDLGVAAILLICGVLVIKGSRFARWVNIIPELWPSCAVTREGAYDRPKIQAKAPPRSAERHVRLPLSRRSRVNPLRSARPFSLAYAAGVAFGP
jgi:hypothetical protein